MSGRDVCPPPPEVIPPLRQRLSLGHVLREYGVVRAPYQPFVFVAQRREDQVIAVSPVCHGRLFTHVLARLKA